MSNQKANQNEATLPVALSDELKKFIKKHFEEGSPLKFKEDWRQFIRFAVCNEKLDLDKEQCRIGYLFFEDQIDDLINICQLLINHFELDYFTNSKAKNKYLIFDEQHIDVLEKISEEISKSTFEDRFNLMTQMLQLRLTFKWHKDWSTDVYDIEKLLDLYNDTVSIFKCFFDGGFMGYSDQSFHTFYSKIKID